jgi:GntR family transcriptional repressor for pyruvate dehydrogenase complex
MRSAQPGNGVVSTLVPEHRLRPVERHTLAQQVMQRLVEYVSDAKLKPGDVLPSQHTLCTQLGVSRPVLREAIQGLASIGVLEIRPGSGCYVGSATGRANPEVLFEIVTQEAAQEALEARMVVEVELAGLAASRAMASDFHAAENALERLHDAVNQGKETSELTLEFHRILASAGHNTFLQRMSELLDQARVAQFMRVEAAIPDVRAGEYESHRVLYEAIRSGDPDRARAAMREHLEVAHGLEERVSRVRRLDAETHIFATIDTTTPGR